MEVGGSTHFFFYLNVLYWKWFLLIINKWQGQEDMSIYFLIISNVYLFFCRFLLFKNIPFLYFFNQSQLVFFCVATNGCLNCWRKLLSILLFILIELELNPIHIIEVLELNLIHVLNPIQILEQNSIHLWNWIQY